MRCSPASAAPAPGAREAVVRLLVAEVEAALGRAALVARDGDSAVALLPADRCGDLRDRLACGRGGARPRRARPRAGGGLGAPGSARRARPLARRGAPGAGPWRRPALGRRPRLRGRRRLRRAARRGRARRGAAARGAHAGAADAGAAADARGAPAGRALWSRARRSCCSCTATPSATGWGRSSRLTGRRLDVLEDRLVLEIGVVAARLAP